MAEEKTDGKSTGKKRRIVFRNSSQRIYYIRTRPGQGPSEKSYLLRPGESVEALDEKEEIQFASMSDLRDVAKESPLIGTSIVSLEKQLAEAKKENDSLKSQNDELEKKTKSVGKQNANRAGK